MIESIISITIISLILLVFSSLTMKSLAISRTNMSEHKAQMFARELIEIAKSKEISDWNELAASPCFAPARCHPELIDGVWEFTAGEELIDTYYRSFTLHNVFRSTETFPNTIVETGGYYDPATIKIEANVRWMDSFGTRQQSIDAYLYNANSVPLSTPIPTTVPTGECSHAINEAAYDYVVHFNNASELRSNGTIADAQTARQSVFIPPDTYEITLVSFDAHTYKSEAPQSHESWFVRLYDEIGGIEAHTHDISDLPDHENYRTEIVNASLTIGSLVKQVEAVHTAYPSSEENSISPLCAAFRVISQTP